MDDGVYKHPVTLIENPANVLTGEMKSITGIKEVLNLKKKDLVCTDSEGNLFQYTLTGLYGKTEIAGCGGDLIKEGK